jgi:spore coat polysaccharide biosynthesis predicted glycosyltransferase SpsG
MQRILIRADARKESGLGHVVRSLALAQMLAEVFHVDFLCEKTVPDFVLQDISSACQRVVTFAATEDNRACLSEINPILKHYQALVIDQYQNPEEIVCAVQMAGCRAIRIVDTDEPLSRADLVFGHSFWQPSKSSENQKNSQGVEYALVRKVFRDIAILPEPPKREIDATLSFGGYDVGNISLKILRALTPITEIQNIALVVGEAYPHAQELELYLSMERSRSVKIYRGVSGTEFAQLLKHARFAFLPASGSALEAATVGTGLVVGITADNQSALHAQLTSRELAFDLGDLRRVEEAAVTKLCQTIISMPNKVELIMNKQRSLLDGQSAIRIIDLFRGVIDG